MWVVQPYGQSPEVPQTTDGLNRRFGKLPDGDLQVPERQSVLCDNFFNGSVLITNNHVLSPGFAFWQSHLHAIYATPIFAGFHQRDESV